MKKRFGSLILALVMAFSLAIPAGAVGDDSKGKENGATVEMVEESIQEPSSPNNLYDYYWDIRVINESRGFGSWREGPSGTGPAYLDINQGTALNRNYTNTISGEYSAGKVVIGNAIGVSIGVTRSYATNYSLEIPAGVIRTIKYRPKVKVQTVKSCYYKVPVGVVGAKPTLLKDETSYVTSFVDWDYSYVNGYM